MHVLDAPDSKFLPYISLAIGFSMAVISVLGYGQQLESVTGFLAVILPITAGGGLVNKALESSVKKEQAFLASENLKKVIAEIVNDANTARVVAKKIIADAGPVEDRTN